MIHRRSKLAAAVATLAVAGGCGLKGPLYLPDEGRSRIEAGQPAPGNASKRRTAPVPAPQVQKEDRPGGDPQTQSEPGAPQPEPDRPIDAPPDER